MPIVFGRIVSVSAQPWTLPLVAPFVIAARTATEARNVRIRIETDAGHGGDGASAPVGYVTGESVESVLDALNAVLPQFAAMPTDRLGPLLALARSGSPASGLTSNIAGRLEVWATRKADVSDGISQNGSLPTSGSAFVAASNGASV